MAKKGTVAPVNDANAAAVQAAWRARASVHSSLLAGLSAIVILAVVGIPVTLDTSSLTPALSSALADNSNSDGNGDGQGRGHGNGKGRGDENGGGNKSQGDDDDHGGGNDDDGGDGDSQVSGDDPMASDRGNASRDDDPGDFGDDMDEAASSKEMTDAASLPAEAMASPATHALPTIREIFALGEESVLNSEQEMLAIKNGWNLQQ